MYNSNIKTYTSQPMMQGGLRHRNISSDNHKRVRLFKNDIASSINMDENGDGKSLLSNSHLKHPFTASSSAKQQKKKTKIISVTSGKGGVGKSVLSVNTALSLAQMGYKVLLFDGDLGLANLNVLFGIMPQYNLYHFIKGKKKLREVIAHTEHGVDIISGANGLPQLANIDVEKCRDIIDEFSSLDDYDIMIVDTGAGIGFGVTLLTLSAEKIMLVTTPEPTAVTDAYGMIKNLFTNNSLKSIELVVNRVQSSAEANSVFYKLSKIANKFLKLRLQNLGFVFEDTTIQDSIFNQKPHILLSPHSKSSLCIRNIAARLINLVEEKASPESGVSNFFSRFLALAERNKKKDIPERNRLET